MYKLFLVLIVLILAVSFIPVNLNIAYADEPWQVQTVDNNPTSGECSSLKLNAGGNPCIAYHTSYGTGLKYACFDGTIWQFQELAPGHTLHGWVNSLAINSLGQPCVSCINGTHNDLYYTVGTGDINLIYYDAGHSIKARSSLALDSTDNPYIVFNFPGRGPAPGPQEDPALKYTQGYVSPVIQTVETGDTGYCSLARENEGHAHISYTNSAGYLKYAYYDGSSWTTQVVDSTVQCGNTSIAVDISSYPHISYYDSTNRHLKYARWNGSSWTIETVDDSCWVGQYNSLALYSSGYPGISYYDEKNGDLKYAHWNGSGWNVFSVDVAGGVGKWTSLAIDSSNVPHISYWDETNLALKYARLHSGLTVTNSSGASEVTRITAVMNGNLVATGGEDPAVHIYWGDNDGGTVPSGWDHDIDLGVLTAGTFSASISSLEPATRYYYRCYAENSQGQCWAGLTASYITNLIGNWITMESDVCVNANAQAIWGNSGSDIFAVGDYGSILHYDGTIWNCMVSGTVENLKAVWGSSGTDVFAIGSAGTILHYDGNSWTPMISGTSNHLDGVWGSSGTDVFAVGSAGTILHYNGTSWSPMASGVDDYLRGIWGTSASDIYAVGNYDGDSPHKNTVLHYDSNSWSLIDCGTERDLSDIWGSSASDIYATYSWASDSHGTGPVTYHYDGSVWSQIKVGYGGGAIWGSGANDIYFVSDQFIRHYDGVSWSEIDLGNPYLMSNQGGVWGTGSDDVFIVGGTNRGGRECNFGVEQAGIYRYTGGGIVPPSVITTAATNVGRTIATLNGTVVNDGGEASQYRLAWDTDSGEPYTSHTEWAGSKTSGQTFSEDVSDLPKGTPIYFRAENKNNAGTSSAAQELSFVTQPDPPSSIFASEGDSQISLTWVKDVGPDGRTLIVRKTDDYPTGISDGTQIYFDTGTSYTDLGLTNGTTYYYSFWGEVSFNGVQQYSDTCTQIHTMPSGPVTAPAVTTNDATDVVYNGAQLNGNLDSLGASSSVDVYFSYGDTPSGPYTLSTPPQNLNSEGAFSAILTDLEPGKSYYFKAFADGGANGIGEGQESSFITSTLNTPTVTTIDATDITASAATLNMAFDFKDYSSGSVQFAYRPTGGSWVYTSWVGKSGSGTYAEVVSDLIPNTNYEFKAWLKYDSTEIEESVLVFTTTTLPRLVFVSSRDGNDEVYWMYVNGAGQTRLTSDPAKEAGPVVSPDGSKIAFTSWRDGNPEIYMMNADGTGVLRLTNNPAPDMWPSWRHDGTRIAFNSSRDGNGEIYVMNADGSGQTRLTNSPQNDSMPTWSPDGTKIAFVRDLLGNSEIYVMNDNGSNVTRLTNHPAEDGWPAWSPDGIKIAFTSNRDGNGEIYIMNADGSNQVNITNTPALDSQPAWLSLPIGHKISFTSNRDGNLEIYTMFANASGLFRLTSNAFGDWTRGYWAAPVVTTNDATNINTNSARLNGNLNSRGSAPNASVSFVWGTAPGSYSHETTAQLMSATGVFSFDLPDLASETTYYYRAKAVGHGIVWGDENSFTTLSNHPPILGLLNLPIDPVDLTTVVNGSANFTDADLGDTHTGIWDWGDNMTSIATINETNGNGTATGTHTYQQAGVYEVKLTITDNYQASAQAIYQFIVIYDQAGGFVTGGGWINSPAGAYTDEPSLTGKATFGFVAKYKKGANVPTGQTEFHFKVANLNFHSESYDWLVVAGAKAQYKGIGTINSASEYGFVLTAIDGQLLGGDKVDKFRIKIWDKATGKVVYDNQMGKDENGDFTTEIQGGSIVIHK